MHLQLHPWERIPQMQVKAKLSLCLSKHHAMKAYWGQEPLVPIG
jgi:hypothetical protein